jgi:hypothetical protein
MKKFLQSCAFCLIILSSSVSVASENFGTICINGYLFAWMNGDNGRAVSLVQIFQVATGNTYVPQPIKCK